MNPEGNIQTDSAAARASIAVLIPCYNEEITIGEVVRQFRQQLPESSIYVFDNNSSDQTSAQAREAGAIVLTERRQGKGYVVQSMFRRVQADVYIMVDGDGTYPPPAVHQLIGPVLRDEADMVVGSRLHHQSHSAFKPLNWIGNRFFLSVVNSVFKTHISDMLSGYRAFNRGFVKSIPLFGGGFEIETELTIKALERGFRVVEVPIDLGTRPEGSQSKIQLWRDGFLILQTILTLFRDYKPLTFFGSVGMIFALAGVVIGSVVGAQYLRHEAFSLPMSFAALGLLLSGVLFVSVGLILHTIVRRFQEFDHQLRVMPDLLIDERDRSRSGGAEDER